MPSNTRFREKKVLHGCKLECCGTKVDGSIYARAREVSLPLTRCPVSHNTEAWSGPASSALHSLGNRYFRFLFDNVAMTTRVAALTSSKPAFSLLPRRSQRAFLFPSSERRCKPRSSPLQHWPIPISVFFLLLFFPRFLLGKDRETRGSGGRYGEEVFLQDSRK